MVYAGSLGAAQAYAELLVRAWAMMVLACAFHGGGGGGEGCAACATSPALHAVGAAAALATGVVARWWAPLVARRVGVAAALPVYVTSLTILTVLSGILFFQDHLLLQGRQFEAQVGGGGLMLLGGLLLALLTPCRDGAGTRITPTALPAAVPSGESASLMDGD